MCLSKTMLTGFFVVGNVAISIWEFPVALPSGRKFSLQCSSDLSAVATVASTLRNSFGFTHKSLKKPSYDRGRLSSSSPWECRIDVWLFSTSLKYRVYLCQRVQLAVVELWIILTNIAFAKRLRSTVMALNKLSIDKLDLKDKRVLIRYVF